MSARKVKSLNDPCICRGGGSLMGHRCSKCDGWEDITALRTALRTERRVSRELRGALVYISEGAECDGDPVAEGTCNSREDESPCAPCAAWRGLARARKARK